MTSTFDALPGTIEAPSAHFVALSHNECVQRLASQTLGRIAWQSVDGPQILPITYVMHDGNAYFRTSPHGMLSQLVEPVDVALEVDEFDQSARTGWSVIIHGRARAVGAPAREAQLWTLGNLVPWAPDIRNLFIEVSPHRLTGRLVTREL